MSIHQIMPAIIAWAVDAAREHVDISKHTGQEIDPEPGFGLAQAFKAAFSLESYSEPERDLLRNTLTDVYTSTVKAFANWTPPPF